MPKNTEVQTRPKPKNDDGGIVILNPKRKCRSIDSDYFETECTGTGTAANLVAAGRAATTDFKNKLDAAVTAVSDAANAWGQRTQCKAGCRKTGYITGPVDWDFPDVKEDLSKSPKSFTVTITTKVRISSTVFCE
jgi:hypothetical protein